MSACIIRRQVQPRLSGGKSWTIHELSKLADSGTFVNAWWLKSLLKCSYTVYHQNRVLAAKCLVIYLRPGLFAHLFYLLRHIIVMPLRLIHEVLWSVVSSRFSLFHRSEHFQDGNGGGCLCIGGIWERWLRPVQWRLLLLSRWRI